MESRFKGALAQAGRENRSVQISLPLLSHDQRERVVNDVRRQMSNKARKRRRKQGSRLLTTAQITGRGWRRRRKGPWVYLVLLLGLMPFPKCQANKNIAVELCPTSPSLLNPTLKTGAIGQGWTTHEGIQLTIQHPFLSSAGLNGIYSGLTYTVSISVKGNITLTESFQAFIVSCTDSEGVPFGIFAQMSPSLPVGLCSRSKNVAHSISVQDVSSQHLFWTTENVTATEHLNFTIYVLQKGKWYEKCIVIPRNNGVGGCHRYVSSSRGTIRRQDLDDDFRNCSEHIVQIGTAPERRTVLQFQSVSLLYGKISECSKEYVEVLNAGDGEWSGTKLCGRPDERKMAGLQFVAQREAIILRIKILEDSSFVAVHYTLDRRKGCNATHSSPSGSIWSPNFPDRYFPGLDCHIRIVVPRGHRAVVRVRRLALELLADGSSCATDHLQLSTSPGDVVRHFCGLLDRYSESHSTLFSSGDVLLHFRSDAMSGGAGGFLLDYAVGAPACAREARLDGKRPSGEILRLSAIEGDDGDASREGNGWEFRCVSLRGPSRRTLALRAHFGLGGRSAPPSAAGVEFEAVGRSDTIAFLNANPCHDGYVELAGRNATWIFCDWRSSSVAAHEVAADGTTVRVVRNLRRRQPAVVIDYAWKPAVRPASPCNPGWVSAVDHCYLLVETPLEWTAARNSCLDKGAHLVSIPNYKTQLLLDAIINESLPRDDSVAVWTGGNDRTCENCYEWTTGKTISYTNWFKGWPQFNYYNWQPSDDGLSEQDCIEMRNSFPYPTKGAGKTEGFFWNDRDCTVANPFVCEKPKGGAMLETRPADCNRTVVLTVQSSSAVVSSPGHPDPYSGNMDCTIAIRAPPRYKIVIAFSTFILEEGPLCQYDYLEISSLSKEPARFCGDWNNRLKLLRRKSDTNRMTLKFVSDVSHNYAGFVADIHMEEDGQLCDGQMIPYDRHCYWFAAHPTVDWHEANRKCSNLQAHLTSIESAEEEAFIVDHIASGEYSTSNPFWLGGFRPSSSNAWLWTDSSPFTYAGTKVERQEEDYDSPELCLSLQWLSLRDSNGEWIGEECTRLGGYVCKKKAEVKEENLNRTLRTESGNLTSPAFPLSYANNLHYTVVLLGPPKTRILVKFLYLDLEWQEQCLYDYVGLRSSELREMVRLCGSDGKRDDKWEFVSESNVAYLTFHSDFSDSGGGFLARYKIVDVSGCPRRSLRSERGSIGSVNYPDPYLNSLDCETWVEVPPDRWTWLEFESFFVGRGGDHEREMCSDDYVVLSMWDREGGGEPARAEDASGIKFCGNLTYRLHNMGFMSEERTFGLRFHSDTQTRSRGFRARYVALTSPEVETIVGLHPNSVGSIHRLNHPMPSPPRVNVTRHFVVPLGFVIQVQLEGAFAQRSDNVNGSWGCTDGWSLEVDDPFLPATNSLPATLCPADNESAAEELLVRSHFNALTVRELTGSAGIPTGRNFKITYAIVKDTLFQNKTASMATVSIPFCHPFACLNNGQCAEANGRRECKCHGHFEGAFCHLTACDSNPCIFGVCNLTRDGHVCSCARGYGGPRCETKLNPCGQNPCGTKGICVVENDRFVCRCHIWWQGPLCEHRAAKIPYKPLSQRMLEEPFWLGLITVFVVLAVLGLVWCIKRKFADKLEKFIAEEIEKSKNQSCKANKRHSIREQGSPVSLSPPTCPKSLFSRIGLRKHSMLSLDSSGSSPNYHENRSFSFDDIIKKSDSQKKLDKRSPSPVLQFDKKELLHSLVAPPAGMKGRRMSLDEFIQMSEKKILERKSSRENASDSEGTSDETSFNQGNAAANRQAFRKRVNFVRTLEKIDSVSFENERDEEALGAAPNCPKVDDFCAGRNCSDGNLSDTGSSCSSKISGLFDEVPESVFSDSTAEMESTRQLRVAREQSDCSSGEADSSWTSSELRKSVRSEVRAEIHRAPNECGCNPAGVDVSKTAAKKAENSLDGGGTPTACVATPKKRHRPRNEMEEFRTAANCCSSQGRPGCSARIGPEGVSKLGPEMASGGASGGRRSPAANNLFLKPHFDSIPKPVQHLAMADFLGNARTPYSTQVLGKRMDFVDSQVHRSPDHECKFDIFPNSLPIPKLQLGSPAQGHRINLPPRVEVCSYNVSDHVRPDKGRPSPIEILPPSKLGSSPHKRLQDLEKTGSLDLTTTTPIITITASNMSSCESDTDSPTKTMARMQYLSPFDVIHQGSERSTSLSNLSSSGYSSMASPGPSRCNSNSPLFGADVETEISSVYPCFRLSPTNPCRKAAQRHLCPNLPSAASPKHRPNPETLQKGGMSDASGAGRRARPPLLRAVSVMRKRSDSETTDEQPEPGSLPEDSNDDEGIGMDHIDFKIHHGEVTSAKDLELYMDGEMSPHEMSENRSATPTPANPPGCPDFVCPAIVVQTLLQNEPDRDRCWKFVRRRSFQRKLSPVSSRSESPMSDRGCQNSADKLSPGYFGSEVGNGCTVYTDSDEPYDGPGSEANFSPGELMPPPGIQPRKQLRRKEKSHGSKSKSANKQRTKSLAETPKENPSKRSPKRRTRVQNSVDADSSSSESSSFPVTRKEFTGKDLRLNLVRNDSAPAYRKRYTVARCDSLPLPLQKLPVSSPTRKPRGDGTPTAMTPTEDRSRWTNGNDEDEQLDEVFEEPLSTYDHDIIATVADRMRSPDPIVEDEIEASKVKGLPDLQLWQVDKLIRENSESSDFSEENSGKEVSYYLKSNDRIAKGENRPLLSPARLSPDMSVICYSGGGFGRKCSDED